LSNRALKRGTPGELRLHGAPEILKRVAIERDFWALIEVSRDVLVRPRRNSSS
jgi:hypothetical protein